MDIIESHIIPRGVEEVRLYDYGVGVFQNLPSRKSLKKAISKGRLLINSLPALSGSYVRSDDIIHLLQPPEIRGHQIKLDLDILFEDDHLAVVYKPAGITVSGNKKWTIYNALIHNLSPIKIENTFWQPKPVHRLDYPTSGALLVAKTPLCLQALSELFAKRDIYKEYLAIAIGKIPEIGSINEPIDNKDALTSYQVVNRVDSTKYLQLNLVVLQPKTGRRHQLRKHLHSIGHPILGDKTYFIDNKIMYGNGLYLHASKIGFVHPVTQQTLEVKAAVPKKFSNIFPKLDI